MEGIYLIVNHDVLTIFGLFMLFLALGTAFAFEFVNGFHDTANAVATVIYTKSLPPTPAVILSGTCNFLGVLAGGTGVAYTIVHLLPAGIVANVNSQEGLTMIYALLIAAIVWNFGTWFMGLPASSSHTLIGSIIGVGLADAIVRRIPYGSEAQFHKVSEVFLTLLISPVFGFCAAALLLLGLKYFIRHEHLHSHPLAHIPPEMLKDLKDPHKTHARPPSIWIRIPMTIASMAVSFTHGSNDGQKGMGIIMLILIGILPANFALNKVLDSKELQTIGSAMARVENLLEKKQVSRPSADELRELNRKTSEFHAKKHIEESNNFADKSVASLSPMLKLDIAPLIDNIRQAREIIAKAESLHKLDKGEIWTLRQDVLLIDEGIKDVISSKGQIPMTRDELSELKKEQKIIASFAEYIPVWVMLGVALALGIGTMVGWKRIVVTIGEKIGKSHMTFAQGLAAQTVAAGTIAIGNFLHMPVSTTHVLSSAVAGTMTANKSGLHSKTIRDIILAWIFTFPAAMLMAGLLYIVLRAIF